MLLASDVTEHLSDKQMPMNAARRLHPECWQLLRCVLRGKMGRVRQVADHLAVILCASLRRVKSHSFGLEDYCVT